MSNSDVDRWAQVLSGKEEPADREARQAASLRRLFLRRSARELNPPPDSQRLKRLLNRIENDPKLQSAAAGMPAAPSSGLLRAVWEWLFPSSGSPMRLSLAAAALAAVVAVPLFIQQAPHDDGREMRSLPGVPGSAPVNPGDPQTVFAADPASDARRLVQAFASKGVSATLVADGDGYEVVARLREDQRTAASSALMSEGLRPMAGDVRVRFRPRP